MQALFLSQACTVKVVVPTVLMTFVAAVNLRVAGVKEVKGAAVPGIRE